ncbi:hypothetical protein [Alicyclobacillus kakegawensis]|uniref:hypothetical protein n=1 Tax=Alicyclobacillus kakegawensis TaxID=392012 RepID=UPI000829749A|nr:hypothetical protein [Alicyclobacillus kakegawensis]
MQRLGSERDRMTVRPGCRSARVPGEARETVRNFRLFQSVRGSRLGGFSALHLEMLEIPTVLREEWGAPHYIDEGARRSGQPHSGSLAVQRAR